MKSSLKSLVEIISQNVDILDAALDKRGALAPSLDDPFQPGSDVVGGQPELMATADVVCRASQQLIQLIRLPQLTVLQDAVSHLVSVSMRCAVELHIAEILKEAGSEGLHIKAIAEHCNVDQTKLVSVLRCLSGRWIFREVSPDVFANNRFSSLLDKGKPLAELRQNPETMYDKPQAALSATIGHFTDECLKSSAFFYEAMTDPDLAFSGEPNETGFNRAFNTKESFWDFLEQPEQKPRLHRFTMAMDGIERTSPPNHPLVGFEWASLPDGATVVDVGGGIGSLAAKIAENHPKLRFVVQDRPSVVENGLMRYKDLVNEGRLSFQAHDFFEPNPVKNADVFMLKRIAHDWSDSFVTKILRQLHDAAGANTRLVSIDRIVPYTCPIPPEDASMQIPGVIKPNFPSPITTAFADNASFKASVLMMTVLNGQERTLKHTIDLFATAGWKITNIVQFEGQGAVPSYICAAPI